MRTLAAAALVALGVSAGAPQRQVTVPDVTVVSGKLAHHYLTNDLFRIDRLWMQVAPDTLFHRWMSTGINGKAEVILTTTPGKFGDRPNVRILSGRMMHQTSPNSSPILHTIFLLDEQTGSLGAVTFETDDRRTAHKFDAFEGQSISIVIMVDERVRR